MSEEQAVATETVSDGTTQESSQDSSNEKNIAESKKYRKRAQDAEAERDALKAEIEARKEAKMMADGKKDEVIAKYKANNESLTEKAERYDALVAKETETILSKFPEEEREELASLGISSLRILNSKIENTKPNAPEVAGSSKTFTTNKAWGDMSDAERRAYYTEKAKGF